MKKTAFKQPAARPAPAAADDWVANRDAAPAPADPRPSAPAAKPARLTIDLPEDLHARFKAACARRRTRMVDEVRTFIEAWTQEHG